MYEMGVVETPAITEEGNAVVATVCTFVFLFFDDDDDDDDDCILYIGYIRNWLYCVHHCSHDNIDHHLIDNMGRRKKG